MMLWPMPHLKVIRFLEQITGSDGIFQISQIAVAIVNPRVSQHLLIGAAACPGLGVAGGIVQGVFHAVDAVLNHVPGIFQQGVVAGVGTAGAQREAKAVFEG